MGLQVGGGASWQNNNSSGTSSGSSSGTSRSTPVAPGGWEDAWRGFMPDSPFAGPGQYFQNFADRPSHTLATLPQLYPDLYQPIEDVSAPTISAQTGAEFMGAYRNPFESQVVDAALSDLGRNYDRSVAASDLAQSAAGAFGGGRHGLRDAAMADDYLRTVAATSGGLRSQGFNTAAQFGQADAGRFLDAARSNQMAQLQAAMANQATRQQGQMFDVNAAYQGDEMRSEAVRDWMTAQGLDQAGNLDWLRAGLPLFGQEGETSNSFEGSTESESSGSGNVVRAGFGGK